MRKNEIKVAIIDNSIDSSVYNPVEHWSSYLDVAWEAFRASQSHFPDMKKAYTHIILTGSESSILDGENWVYDEVEFVQEAVEKGLSILGSCYGHQVLVLALLGKSYVQRCLKPEVGWIPIQIKKESGLLGKKRTAFSFSIHFDETVNLSDAFAVLASSQDCKIQAFQMKKRPIWGLQIHPEIDISNAQKFLNKLISLNLKTKPFFTAALSSRPRDSDLIQRIVKCFFTPRDRD
jgi:GMP synthase-like glutamine amidotransferase